MAEPGKANVIVMIPTPIYLAAFIALALAFDALTHAAPLAWLKHPIPGVALIAAGIVLAVSARNLFARIGTEVMPASAMNSKLVTTGPFAFTRNPMYLGLVVVGIGAALIAGTAAMLIVPIAVFLIDNFIIIPFEEQKMERQFGESFREYKRRVRRWI